MSSAYQGGHGGSHRDERPEGTSLPVRESRGAGGARTSRSPSPLPAAGRPRSPPRREPRVGDEEDDSDDRDRERDRDRDRERGGGDRRSPAPVTETVSMIANMKPYLHSDTYVFTELPYEAGAALPALLPHLHSLTTEEEAMSLIIPRSIAKEHGLPTNLSPRMKHIELTVRSGLEGVGLTAAVSSALGAGEIACNIVAGLRHDHVFVPEDRADMAMDVLKALSKQSRKIERGQRRAPWDEDDGRLPRDPADAPPAKSAREERRERRKEESV